jgi:hypothetical protein
MEYIWHKIPRQLIIIIKKKLKGYWVVGEWDWKKKLIEKGFKKIDWVNLSNSWSESWNMNNIIENK